MTSDEPSPVESESPAAQHSPGEKAGADEAAVEADLAELADPAVLLQQRDEYLDSLRRLQADFDNYRKRMQRDQEMAGDRAAEKLVAAMLPVLDTFEMALSHEENPNGSSLAKLHDQLLSALEMQGLERLAPMGEPFDPADAEAVMHETGDEPSAGPMVSEVLRAGYRWRSRVLRAAMVKVRD